ncbi:MAG: hypothetical protein HYW47_07400 [Deltaproteobacteria bacterium]|nr:hypothetical protein [Deltaproteobacteria bacterium]
MGREWIEKLAKEEISIEETGEFDLHRRQDEQKLLEELALQFLYDLRREFTTCINSFNTYRGEQRNTIKIYGIQGTESDFLVFRNSLKLIVAKERPGTISLSFTSLRGGLKSANDEGSDYLEAELGPFNDAQWKFKSQPVTAQALVRYYLTEFIKNSLN